MGCSVRGTGGDHLKGWKKTIQVGMAIGHNVQVLALNPLPGGTYTLP